MSGLFKRLSTRRSGGPEGDRGAGPTDAPTDTPAEPEGRQSLLTDPAAATHDGQRPAGMSSGDPLAAARGSERRHARGAAFAEPAAGRDDPNAHTLYGAPAGPHATPNYGAPAGPAPFAEPVPAALVYNAPVYVPPPTEPVADLPAGLDPDELGAAPGTSARRGKLRRRAAFLRAARELLLRDLGGFVYELHRTAHDIEHEAHRRLRETKLARLERVDAELHELEMRLDDVRRQVLVREPGVGGECPHCGELFGSAAHYCSHCGNPLTDAARRELAKAQCPRPSWPSRRPSLPSPRRRSPPPSRSRPSTTSRRRRSARWSRAPSSSGRAARPGRGPSRRHLRRRRRRRPRRSARATRAEPTRVDDIAAATPVGEGEPAAAAHDDLTRTNDVAAATPAGEATP